MPSPSVTSNDVGGAMVGPGSISTRLPSAHEAQPGAASARASQRSVSGSRSSGQGQGDRDGQQRPPPAARGRLSARRPSFPAPVSPPPFQQLPSSSESAFDRWFAGSAGDARVENEVYISHTGAGVVFDGEDGLRRVRL